MKKILSSIIMVAFVSVLLGSSSTLSILNSRTTLDNNQFSTGTWDTGPEPARLVINEVMYDPSGPEPNGEWIELYNAGGVSIDLSGYSLADNTSSLALTSLVLNPGEFAVYARDAGSFTTNYGFAPNFSGSSIALGNSGDYITLYDPNSVLVDVVVWGTASFPGVIAHYDVIQDHVLARYPDGTDTDDCSVDFIDSTNKTPGVPNV
jgi:hypothetical protein